MRKRRSVLRIAIAVLMICTLLLPAGVAFAENSEVACSGESKNFSYIASSQQIEKINQLWGERISRAEFIKEVFPEALAQIPKEVVQNLDKVEMEWPDPNGKPGGFNKVSPQGLIPWVVGTRSKISANQNKITFESGNKLWLPRGATLLYQNVFSFLWEKTNSGAKLIASTFNVAYNADECVAKGTYWIYTLSSGNSCSYKV